MSNTEVAAEQGGTAPGTTSAALALGVALTLAVLTALVVLVLIYSTDNTPASVNGRTATSSSYTPGE